MPRGGPMGRGGNPTDKAKDFKGAMKRLFSELKPFKILIFISIVLAILGSIMSIIAPNKLSDLTDKISEGLVVNKDNMGLLAEKVQTNFRTNNFEEIVRRYHNKEITNIEAANMLNMTKSTFIKYSNFYRNYLPIRI